MAKYMHRSVPGFTSQDNLDFQDLLVKANVQQLKAMLVEVERHLEMRSEQSTKVEKRKNSIPSGDLVCPNCGESSSDGGHLLSQPKGFCVYCLKLDVEDD